MGPTRKILILPIFAVLISIMLFSTHDVLAAPFIPFVFHISGVDVPSSADTQTITTNFNPKEIVIDKSVQWEPHRHAEPNSPALEFSIGTPPGLGVELFFDTFEEKTSVKELTDKVASLAVANPGGHKPNCLVTVGQMEFKCVLESFSVKYTLFLDDGTPVRATANLVFKEFSPADKKLTSYTLTEENLLRLLDASSGSLSLLHSYVTDSLTGVVNKLFANLQVEQSKSIFFSSGAANSGQGTASPLVFNVRISGKTNQENSWESPSGGSLMIEVVDTTVGSDQFHTHSPGHKSIEDITLRGIMTKNREAILDWLNNHAGGNCENCKVVTLSLYSNGNLLSQTTYSVIDAYYFKNEVFLLQTQGDKLDAKILNIERYNSDGTKFAGPPRILVVLPTSIPNTDLFGLTSIPFPVIIAGTNFDQSAIPYFGNIAGGQLFNFGLKNLPLVGSVSAGIAYCPGGLPSGTQPVTIVEYGQTSNAFPITRQ